MLNEEDMHVMVPSTHMQKLKCFFGRHLSQLVATDSSCGWTSGGKRTSSVHISFYTCQCCGKRTTNTLSAKDRLHEPAMTILDRWIRAGYLDDDAKRIHKKTATIHQLYEVKI